VEIEWRSIHADVTHHPTWQQFSIALTTPQSDGCVVCPACVTLELKQGRFNRGKAMLRLLGSDLQAYLDDHKLA
jgi:hypothetical protein